MRGWSLQDEERTKRSGGGTLTYTSGCSKSPSKEFKILQNSRSLSLKFANTHEMRRMVNLQHERITKHRSGRVCLNLQIPMLVSPSKELKIIPWDSSLSRQFNRNIKWKGQKIIPWLRLCECTICFRTEVEFPATKAKTQNCSASAKP